MPEPPQTRLALNPLVLGAWFALIGGLADFVFFVVTSVLMGRYVHLSPDLVWISPLSNVFLLALPGLLLLALARWRPAPYWTFVALSVFAFLTAWGLSTYATRVHRAAAFALAVGIAIQTARLISAHPRGTRTLIRYSLPAMAAVSLIGALAFNARDRFNESRALANLPPARVGLPNIFLIILDTVRAANLSLYGYSRRTTPALEHFASRGVSFDLALSPAPWTLPSHATLFTGRWPHELNANWRSPLDATHSTLAEVLAESGYVTGGFIANRYYVSRESGLARGFQHYDDFQFSLARVLFGSALGRYLIDSTPLTKWVNYRDQVGRKRASDVNAEVLDWLAHRDADGRPVFVFLNYFDAHHPYVPPAPFDTLFGKQVMSWRPVLTDDSLAPKPEIIAAETDAYDESIAALDNQIGMLLSELDRRGALRNSIVVITSDHGEALGEHGLMRHGNSLFIQELHVPLIIAFDRGVPAGLRVSKPVTLRDVPATIIDLARVPNQSSTSSMALAGRSLARSWTDTVKGRSTSDTVISEVRKRGDRQRWAPVNKGDMASILDGTQHLIRGGDGALEMYQINTDPREENNLAGTAEVRDAVQRLSTTLRAVAPVRVRRYSGRK
jgi:arylsulfatase A-like enzyme